MERKVAALEQELETYKAHVLRVEGFNKILARERDEARKALVVAEARVAALQDTLEILRRHP